MRIFITGGAGFIGSNLTRYLIGRGSQAVVLDKLTYAGNLANLDGLTKPYFHFEKVDVADAVAVRAVFEKYRPQAVLHLAAESHVDRSIDEPGEFVRTNVLGTQVLLDAARDFDVERFVQVSTDEVYGALGEQGTFTENSPLQPNSPYSASKAASDLLVRSYVKTYGMWACVTRCSNNYGPCQFPEKLIPLFATNAMEDTPLPVYGEGKNVRDWIHVHDHCRALEAALLKGRSGEVYNIGADNELSNVEITRLILKILDKPESLIRFVADRPGHDFRYAIDNSKIRKELGWKPEIRFEDGLAETVRWYVDNKEWWRKIKSGEYRTYYEKMYGRRLDD